MTHNHRSRVRIPLQMVPCFCERREQRLYILCYRNINWITGDCCRENIGEVKSLACIKKERVLYKGIKRTIIMLQLFLGKQEHYLQVYHVYK